MHNTPKHIRIWNSLPNVFRVNENYREFSRLIQNWSGPMCKCIVCRQWIFIQSIFIYSCKQYVCDTKHTHTDFPLILSALVVFDCYFFKCIVYLIVFNIWAALAAYACFVLI